MVKIANLTVNSMTGSFDSEFPTDEEIFSSTLIYDKNRRRTRTQQFYHEAGISPSFQQHSKGIPTERIADPLSHHQISYVAPDEQPQTSEASTQNVIFAAAEEVVNTQIDHSSHLENISYVPTNSEAQMTNATATTSTTEENGETFQPAPDALPQTQFDADTGLQDTQITLVSMGSINHLLQIMQTVQQKQDAFQTICIAEFASLHTKLDAIASRCVVSEDPFSPVNSAEELHALEEKAKNMDFFRNVALRLGKIVGKGTPGGTAALLLIYKFFDRTFLLSCSWSGKARSESKTKIGLVHCTNIVNLFVETVQYCDPNFTAPQCQSFLKTRLKNAKQNCSLKNARSTACRPNRMRKMDSVPQLTDGNGETFDDVDDENEETEKKAAVRPKMIIMLAIK